MVIRAKRVSLQEGLKFDVLNVQDEMLQELQEGQRAQSIQFDEHCFRGSQLTIDEIQQEQGDGPSAAKAAEMEAFYPSMSPSCLSLPISLLPFFWFGLPCFGLPWLGLPWLGLF